MDNVCDSSLAFLKTCSRLSIGYNCAWFASSSAEALLRRNRTLLKGWIMSLGAKYRVERGMVLLQLCR